MCGKQVEQVAHQLTGKALAAVFWKGEHHPDPGDFGFSQKSCGGSRQFAIDLKAEAKARTQGDNSGPIGFQLVPAGGSTET